MGNRIRVDGIFLIILALSVMILPLKWLLSWLVAALVHELCHFLALKVFRCQIFSIRVGFCGTEIETEPMKPMADFLSTIAGPAGSFSLLLLSKHLPSVAICGCIQGIYNLIPINLMDGGRITSIIVNRIFPSSFADRVLMGCRWVTYALLLFAGLYILKSTLIFVPLAYTVLAIMKDIKRPCKSRVEKVQ